MTRSSFNIHYPLYIPACLPTVFCLLLIYTPQFQGTDQGFNLEFNLSPISILRKLSPLLDAFVTNFLSNCCREEWLPDNSISIWNSRMIKEFWRKAIFQPLFTRPLHKKRRLSISRDPQSLIYCCKKADKSESHTDNEWHRSPPAPNMKRATAPQGCPNGLGENSK